MEQLNFGDRIFWNGVSKICSGVIEKVAGPQDLLVRLDSGQYVIVNIYSIKKVEHK